MTSPTSPRHATVHPTPASISIQLDGQRILLRELDSEESKTSTGGRIDTVTVVAYPSGIFSTLPPSQSHDFSATPAQTLSASSPQLPLSARPTTSNAIDEPSSISPSTSFSPSSLSYSQPTATDVETLSEQGSITGSFSSSSLQFHPTPAITLGGFNNTQNSSGARNSGSNLAHLDPPVYVGIALGSIAAFAVLCAMVAWCIRFWYSRRRRKNSAIEVPWAQSHNCDFNGLEAGGNPPADWHADSSLLTGNSMAELGRHPGVRHWIAGRNAEEPRRSDGYGGDVPGFLRGHHIPNPQFFSEGAGGGNPGLVFENYKTPRPIRQSLALRPDRMGGEYEVGTPREEHPTPRYLSLKGDALELPWSRNTSERAPSPPPPRSAVERLRRASKPARQTLPRSIPSDHSVQSVRPPAPGPIQAKQEGWAGSITSNLVNAFNAVAANIHPFKGDGEAHDMLTPKPSRRGTGRKFTLHDTSDPSMERSHLEPSSPNSPSSLSTDSSSVPWTLEEYADGTGVVHLNISPSKRRLDSSGSTHSPSRGRSTPHLSSSHSSIPLVASNIPQAALLRPEISHHFRAQPDDQVSRQSSYSQQSSSASTSDNASFTSTEPLSLTKKRRKNLSNEAKKDKQSPLASSLRRPSLLSRLSSTSSATSWNSQTSLTTKNKATEALRVRKRTPYSKELDLR